MIEAKTLLRWHHAKEIRIIHRTVQYLRPCWKPDASRQLESNLSWRDVDDDKVHFLATGNSGYDLFHVIVSRSFVRRGNG